MALPLRVKRPLPSSLKYHIGRLYTVDYGVVKKQIAGYKWEKDGQIAKAISYNTLDAATKSELLIIALLPPSKSSEEYERIRNIAQKNDRKLLNIEITTPHDVLIEHYKQRLQTQILATQNAVDVGVTTLLPSDIACVLSRISTIK